MIRVRGSLIRLIIEKSQCSIMTGIRKDTYSTDSLVKSRQQTALLYYSP
jgi:hypothetical protein